MNLTLDVQKLSHHKAFGNLCLYLMGCREDLISSMRGKSGEELLQLSGQILTYDEILKAVDAEAVIRRTADIPE
jgi:hypothetical protein